MPRGGTLLALAAAAVVVLVVYALRGALWPFLAGMVIAYLLDPVADRLEQWKCPRGIAAFLIVAVFLLVLIAVMTLLLPALLGQIAALLGQVPQLLESLRAFAKPLLQEATTYMSDGMIAQARSAMQDMSAQVVPWAVGAVRGMLSGGLALVNLLSVLVIMPVVAFYLLRDWDRIVALVDSLIPRRVQGEVQTVVREIDVRLSGFIRGQSLVCLVLATWYAVALAVVGLRFGLVVGIMAGLISFIPYVGTVVGVSTGLGLALFQFSASGPVIAVAVIFVIGQAMQDLVLTPKLIGERVGLHPAWVLFALMAGGTLLGFTGVLLAVPVAAALGVLVRYAVNRYRGTDLYGGAA